LGHKIEHTADQLADEAANRYTAEQIFFQYIVEVPNSGRIIQTITVIVAPRLTPADRYLTRRKQCLAPIPVKVTGLSKREVPQQYL